MTSNSANGLEQNGVNGTPQSITVIDQKKTYTTTASAFVPDSNYLPFDSNGNMTVSTNQGNVLVHYNSDDSGGYVQANSKSGIITLSINVTASNVTFSYGNQTDSFPLADFTGTSTAMNSAIVVAENNDPDMPRFDTPLGPFRLASGRGGLTSGQVKAVLAMAGVFIGVMAVVVTAPITMPVAIVCTAGAAVATAIVAEDAAEQWKPQSQ